MCFWENFPAAKKTKFRWFWWSGGAERQSIVVIFNSRPVHSVCELVREAKSQAAKSATIRTSSGGGFPRLRFNWVLVVRWSCSARNRSQMFFSNHRKLTGTVWGVMWVLASKITQKIDFSAAGKHLKSCPSPSREIAYQCRNKGLRSPPPDTLSTRVGRSRHSRHPRGT